MKGRRIDIRVVIWSIAMRGVLSIPMMRSILRLVAI